MNETIYDYCECGRRCWKGWYLCEKCLTPVDKAIWRLEVGAVEDLTYEEIDALLEEIRELREVAIMFDNVMSTMNVGYKDMSPDDDEK